jgi:hypothetical protein
MTALATLEQLARAAIEAQHPPPDRIPDQYEVDLTRLELRAALSPERVLSLLAVVKAAQAMRGTGDYVPALGEVAAFDAAIAHFERMP